MMMVIIFTNCHVLSVIISSVISPYNLSMNEERPWPIPLPCCAQVVHFSRDAVRTMVRKMPMLLNWETSNFERKIDDMRHLAYTRCELGGKQWGKQRRLLLVQQFLLMPWAGP